MMADYRIKGLANQNSGYRIKGLAQPQSDLQTNQGISSIPGYIGDVGLNLIMSAGEKAMKIPDEVTDAASQIMESPISGIGRAGANILSGMLEGGKQLYNFPFNINTYLGSKGVPLFKQTMGLAEKLKFGDT